MQAMPTAEENSCPAEEGGATGIIIPHPALRRLAIIRRQFELSLRAEIPSEAPPAQQISGALACWRSSARRTLFSIAMFSIVANVLMLILLLAVFSLVDQVLPGSGIRHLLVLPLLTIILLAAMAMLDIIRSRALNHLAASMETILGGALLSALMISPPAQERGYVEALRRLHDVRRFLASATMLRLLDAPVLPLCFATILYLDTGLGAVVLISALVNVAALRCASASVPHALAGIAIMGWGVYFVLAGTLSIGMAIACSIIAGRALRHLGGVLGASQASIYAWVAYHDVCRALEITPASIAKEALPLQPISLSPAIATVLPFAKRKLKSRHIAMSC